MVFTLAAVVPSRLMVIRSNPAKRKAVARSAVSKVPLVVRAMSSRPAARSGCKAPINSSTWGCNNGSPPVSRRERTPKATAASTTATRCSRVSKPGGS